MNTRFRAPGTGPMMTGGFNQNQKGTQRFVSKQKKPKSKKEGVKKTANEAEDDETEKKTILKDEEADKKEDETNENG